MTTRKWVQSCRPLRGKWSCWVCLTVSGTSCLSTTAQLSGHGVLPGKLASAYSRLREAPELPCCTAKIISVQMFTLEALVSWNLQDWEEGSTVSWQWCD